MVSISQSTLWALFGISVGLIAILRTRHTRRMGVALATGVLVACGFLVWYRSSIEPARQARRTPSARAEQARKEREALELARVTTTQAFDVVRHAWHETQMSVRADLPDAHEIGRNFRDAIRAGVRLDGQKLVIGAHVALPLAPPAPPSPPIPVATLAPESGTGVEGPPEPDEAMADDAETAADESATDTDEALTEGAQEDMASQLKTYFDELVKSTHGETPALERLRAALANLPPDERSQVAAEVARLDDVVDEDQTVTTGDAASGRTTHRVLIAQVDPVRIERIVKTGQFRQREVSRVSTVAVAFGTIGVLLAATLVLKSATRRHAARAFK